MPAHSAAVHAAAAAAAHGHHAQHARARKEHCLKVDQEFVSQTATAEEKQDYIACQQVLAPPAPQYREPVRGDFALKVGGGMLLVWLLVAAIAAACVVYERKNATKANS